MSNETDNLDLDIDFSISDQDTSVAPLESFLDDFVKDEDVHNKNDDLVIEVDEPIIETDDVIIQLDDSIINDPILGNDLDYKQVISKLIDSKLIDSIDLLEDENGEQISFQEANVDEETFVEILKQSISKEKDNVLQNKVSTEGISDFTKKLIEIEKNGGNVQQALESFNRFKNPLDGLNLENVTDQQAVLVLKYEAQGLGDTEIISIIEKFQQDGLLEEKANEAKNQIETAFNNQLEKINEDAIQRKKDNEEALKVYKGSLNDELKSFQLNESYKKKLVDIASKQDKDGRFELDNIYSQMRRDPKTSAELVLFLTNKEEYLKQMTEKVVRDTKIDTMKTLKIVKRGNTSNVNIETDNKDNSKNFIDIDEFK